jgi:hypothetical protein
MGPCPLVRFLRELRPAPLGFSQFLAGIDASNALLITD